MTFEEYTKEEFKKGEKKFDKIEMKIDDIKLELHKIHIALEVDKQIRDAKTKRSALISGGIMSLIISILSHIFKGVF